MVRCLSLLFLAICAAVLFAGDGMARGRFPQEFGSPTPLLEASPTLAPFQHVRFCIKYPSDCKSKPTENERLDLDADTTRLLNHVNHSVNTSITATSKSYGPDLHDGWTIAPSVGDCNDYAVTKRHDLLESGLPSKALRLSVVKTPSGLGHLVLVVTTTKGDLVLDNLTDVIRPWQNTGYRWLKIQSAVDPRFWYDIKAPIAGLAVLHTNQKIRLADR
jgi:predicted transglutaminase-like cysteine proteinase